MNKTWPKVRLGEVLTPIIRAETVDASREYSLLGVRLEGQGPFLRETVRGTETAATKLFRVMEGDFIYSRLFAWRGAFGLIGSDLDGCYVSGEFPTFRPIEDRLDSRFLNYWFRISDTLARVSEDCSSSTPLTRNRFKEKFFLALEIPLPPLSEQQRIVERIEQLATKIEEACGLRKQTGEEAKHTLISMAYRDELPYAVKINQGWVEVALGDVITQIEDKQRVVPDKYYPNLGIYSFGRGLFHKPPIQGFQTSATSLNRVCAGQFIYSRLFAFEGSYGIVTDEFDRHFVSNEYPTFTCDMTKILPEFLYAYFKRPGVWSQIAAGSKGLGDRRQRVQPMQLLSHRMMLPPMKDQIELREIMHRIDSLKRLQSDTAAELDALLPSVLDKAFKGEL